MWTRTALAVTGLAFGAGSLAWTQLDRPAAGQRLRFDVTGTVLTAPEGRKVRVAHDDIPGYMPAMTMAFTLGDRESTELAPGDRVRFALVVRPDGSRAEEVEVTGRSALTEAPGAASAPVARLKPGHRLPDLALVDQAGQAIGSADFRGHATLVTFIFTRCPVPEFCPLVTSRFKDIQAALARDRSLPGGTRLLSITIDPAFDTPPVLDAYARAVGADAARWRFAGGDPDEVTRVARAFSVYVERNGTLLDHTLATGLIGADGRVVEIWRGNGWKTTEVVAALRALPR